MSGNKLSFLVTFLITSISLGGCSLFISAEKKFSQKVSKTFEAGINLGDAHAIYKQLSPKAKKELPPPALQSFLGQVMRYCGRVVTMGEPTLLKEGGVFYPKFTSGKCFIKYSKTEDDLLDSLQIRPYTFKIPPLELDKSLGFEEKARKLSSHYYKNGELVGMAVAIIDQGNIEYLTFGHQDFSKKKDITPDTIFEIGSLSKVYTGVLLAKLISEKKTNLHTKIGQLIKGIHKKRVRSLTLEDLALHRSGLPRLPQSIPLNDPNPYGKYTKKNLLKDLNQKNFKFKFDHKKSIHYSNLGGALLAQGLEKVSQKNYDEMLNEYINTPMSMEHTTSDFQSLNKENLSQGHTHKTSVPHWTFDAFKGAGGIYSSIKDVSKFTKALFSKDGELYSQKELMVGTEVKMTNKDSALLGLFKRSSPNVYWHNGGTAGFSSFMGYNPETQQGIVLLSNVYDAPMTELGLKIMGH